MPTQVPLLTTERKDDEQPNTKYIILSPGDMVYVPEEDAIHSQIDWSNKNKIAKMVLIILISLTAQSG